MWIKTKDGNYYNVDHCRQIYLDGNDCTCFRFDDGVVSIPGDYRYVIIKNIISDTKLLEV